MIGLRDMAFHQAELNKYDAHARKHQTMKNKHGRGYHQRQVSNALLMSALHRLAIAKLIEERKQEPYFGS